MSNSLISNTISVVGEDFIDSVFAHAFSVPQEPTILDPFIDRFSGDIIERVTNIAVTKIVDVAFGKPSLDSDKFSTNATLSESISIILNRFFEWIKAFFSSTENSATIDEQKTHLILDIEIYNPRTNYKTVIQQCKAHIERQDLSKEEKDHLKSKMMLKITKPPIETPLVQHEMLNLDLESARKYHTQHVISCLQYSFEIESQASEFIASISKK